MTRLLFVGQGRLTGRALLITDRHVRRLLGQATRIEETGKMPHATAARVTFV